MKVTGSNVFSIAQRVLTSQVIDYYRYKSRESNQIGLYATEYDAPITIKGNFQPVPKTTYEKLGLDLQKTYWRLWAKIDFIDIQRGVSGDNIEFNGRRFQCESSTPWYQIDGWTEILCIDIGKAVEQDVGYGVYGVYGGGD